MLPRAGCIIYHTFVTMRRGTIILLILVLLAGLAVAVAASILHHGLSARATPTKLESVLAREAHHLSIPAGARNAKNPLPDSAENVRDARLHFADHCATCHANDGSGDTMIGQGLYPKPPDLRTAGTQSLSDGELFWIIENGVRFTGMPAFGGGHGTQEDSWKLVRFLRHLPQLTIEERMEMERNNPKSPGDRAEDQEENKFLGGATSKEKPESQLHRH
jgi:mono/diheme cytochrome c family protein